MKTKEGKEVGFTIAVDGNLKQLIEIKWSDNNFSKSLLFFCERFPEIEAFQVVYNLKQPQHLKGMEKKMAKRLDSKKDLKKAGKELR